MKRRKQSDAGRSHTCPICEASVAADVKTFPFCSERCRNVDLGRWFGESYRVSRPLRDDDEIDQFDEIDPPRDE